MTALSKLTCNVLRTTRNNNNSGNSQVRILRDSPGLQQTFVDNGATRITPIQSTSIADASQDAMTDTVLENDADIEIDADLGSFSAVEERIEANIEQRSSRRQRSQAPHFSVQQGQKLRNEEKIRQLLLPVQNYCNSIQLEIESLTIKLKNTDNIKDNLQLNIVNEFSNIPQTKKIKALKTLEAKDKANCSDKGYTYFKDLDFVQLPTLKEVITVRKEINEFF